MDGMKGEEKGGEKGLKRILKEQKEKKEEKKGIGKIEQKIGPVKPKGLRGGKSKKGIDMEGENGERPVGTQVLITPPVV